MVWCYLQPLLPCVHCYFIWLVQHRNSLASKSHKHHFPPQSVIEKLFQFQVSTNHSPVNLNQCYAINAEHQMMLNIIFCNHFLRFLRFRRICHHQFFCHKYQKVIQFYSSRKSRSGYRKRTKIYKVHRGVLRIQDFSIFASHKIKCI